MEVIVLDIKSIISYDTIYVQILLDIFAVILLKENSYTMIIKPFVFFGNVSFKNGKLRFLSHPQTDRN